jgi:hypothetical protein
MGTTDVMNILANMAILGRFCHRDGRSVDFALDLKVFGLCDALCFKIDAATTTFCEVCAAGSLGGERQEPRGMLPTCGHRLWHQRFILDVQSGPGVNGNSFPCPWHCRGKAKAAIPNSSLRRFAATPPLFTQTPAKAMTSCRRQESSFSL